MLSTDGNVTFITFMYENFRQVRSIVGSGSAAVGFDAGDNSRSTSIPINFVNIFRIDGMWMLSVFYSGAWVDKKSGMNMDHLEPDTNCGA